LFESALESTANLGPSHFTLNATINPNCTTAAKGFFDSIANGNISYATYGNDGDRRGLKGGGSWKVGL
jgi:hypothetical protein